MGVPSEADFARRYRALSADERRAFVAALWAARGWETTREEGTGVVLARRDGGVRRIAVGTPVPDDADVVVADGTQRVLSTSARRRAEAIGATYVPPVDLRERLLYGVDRDVAHRLFQEHFGTDLATAGDADAAVPIAGWRRVVRAGRSAVAGERSVTEVARSAVGGARSALGGARSAVATTAVAALVIAVLAVLFAGGFPAIAGIGTDPGDVDRAAPPEPVDGEYAAAAAAIGSAESAERNAATLNDSEYLGLYETGLTGTLGSTARTPPGVFLTGVYDADTLADAHVETVGNLSSASLLLVASGPENATDSDATTGGRVGIAGDGGVVLGVESATRYRLVGSANASIVNATHDGTVEVFADGDAVYERTAGPAGSETRRVPSSDAPDGTELVGTTAEEPIRRFLNGSNSTVRPAATDIPLYRIEVSGEPAALGDEVSDFRSVAFVTADGLVLELSAEYVHEPTGERVRVAFRYDRLDDTTVVPPAWYQEVESGSETAA